MLLTPTNSLIILLGLAITWCVLFSLFNEKSSLQLGLKLGLLVLILSPLIATFSYNSYAMLSRQWFFMSANGEIQLPYSPLKIPHSKNKNYCDQFKDSTGKSINSFSINDGKGYCGYFWGMYSENPVFVPYKILGKNKAVYWASPELQITGPIPEFWNKSQERNADNMSSRTPDQIYVKEGRVAKIKEVKSDAS